MYFLRKTIFHFPFFHPKKNNIFSRKNTIFPDNTRTMIFQCNFFRKTIFWGHLKKISYFHVFFREKSSLIFRLKNKMIFSRKINIVFPDNTRKIISQRNFFNHLFRTFAKMKYGFSCSANNNTYDKILDFKNNALFITCISKINNTLNGNAEELDIIISIAIWLSTPKIIQKQQQVCGGYY